MPKFLFPPLRKTIFGWFIIAFGTGSSLAVTITGFGTGQFQTTYSDFITSQTATNLTVSGATDDGNIFVGKVQTGSIDTPVNIVGLPEIKLTLMINSAISSAFSIELLDSDSESVGYDGSFSLFTVGVPSTISLTRNPALDVGTFNGLVSRIVFTANGTGLSSVDVSFDELLAIPEPSSLALLGGAGLLAFRRVRRRV